MGRCILTVVLCVSFFPAMATEPVPRCPPSQATEVVAKLRRDIIFKEARVSDEMMKALEEAAYADAQACLTMARHLYREIEKNLRLEEQSRK